MVLFVIMAIDLHVISISISEKKQDFLKGYTYDQFADRIHRDGAGPCFNHVSCDEQMGQAKVRSRFPGGKLAIYHFVGYAIINSGY